MALAIENSAIVDISCWNCVMGTAWDIVCFQKDPMGPFYYHRWTLIPAWISNHMIMCSAQALKYTTQSLPSATYDNL